MCIYFVRLGLSHYIDKKIRIYVHLRQHLLLDDILHAISSSEKYNESNRRLECRALQLSESQPNDDVDCCE